MFLDSDPALPVLSSQFRLCPGPWAPGVCVAAGRLGFHVLLEVEDLCFTCMTCMFARKSNCNLVKKQGRAILAWFFCYGVNT